MTESAPERFAVMDRRTSLKLLIALATALSPLASAATTNEALCASALADGIDVAALAQLASQLRRAYPESVDWPSIAPLLQASSASFDETLALLRKRMTEDFARGRVVDLYGWRVSRMEANLFLALHECA